MAGVGQRLLPLLRKGEAGVGQVALIGEMTVLLVRFPVASVAISRLLLSRVQRC